MEMILPRIVPRSMVRRLDPDLDVHMGQFSMVEQVSTARWLMVKITSNGEVAVMVSELWSAWRAERQVSKQLHVAVLGAELDM